VSSAPAVEHRPSRGPRGAAVGAGAVVDAADAAGAGVASGATTGVGRDNDGMVENVRRDQSCREGREGRPALQLQRARRGRGRQGQRGNRDRQANEVSEAVRKPSEAARRKMTEVPLTGGRIPHEIIGKHGAGRVLLKPAASGTGVIAVGRCARCWSAPGSATFSRKSLGSTNPHNMVRATLGRPEAADHRAPCRARARRGARRHSLPCPPGKRGNAWVGCPRRGNTANAKRGGTLCCRRRGRVSCGSSRCDRAAVIPTA